MTIRSLMVAIAVVAAVMTVIVEFGSATLLLITVIFVPATGIGIWQHFGFRGILVETIPSWLAWLVLWRGPVSGESFLVFSPLIMILTALLLWCVMQCVRREVLRALIRQMMWGAVSFVLSVVLLPVCLIVYVILTSPL